MAETWPKAEAKRDMVIARAVDALFGAKLVMNMHRGVLVEAMIDLALRDDGWTWNSGGWDAFDFIHESGTRLEVKQSATIQRWVSPPGQPRFDIAKRDFEWLSGAGWVPMKRRAELYVLAHHPETDPATADHADPAQWEFYVLGSTGLPTSKTIGLPGVKRLAAPVPHVSLQPAVRAMLQTLSKPVNQDTRP